MISTFEEYIDILDNQEHPASRRAVLEEVSEDVLFRTIKERPDLKIEVIRNKLVPMSVLEFLIDDPDPYVRSWIAKKRKLPFFHLEKLARDSDERVRSEVVDHRKISKRILEILTQDEQAYIAEQAKRRLDEQDYLD